jgi:hypothetical protein
MFKVVIRKNLKVKIGRLILTCYIFKWFEPIQMGPLPIALKLNFTSENVRFEAD